MSDGASSTYNPSSDPATNGFRIFTPGPKDFERFKANLAAFNTHTPWMMPALDAIKFTATQLMFNDAGDFDIAFRGELFFNGGSRKWATDRVEDFENKPNVRRISTAPIETKNLDDISNEVIIRILRRCVEDEDISFAFGAVDVTCYHLVVMGVGLADHLPLLIERTDCHNLILIEPNVEILYHSLFTFDWVSLFNDFDVPGKKIWFIQEHIPDDIKLATRDCIRLTGANFVEGTFVLQAYPSTILEQAAYLIYDDAALMATGMGFLEDEFDMVRNSYNNLRGYEGPYFRSNKKTIYIPVFVIASGPSLDIDLEFLRENQKKVFIISCGTTLRILLHNGIIPDIQVEMENVPLVADLMEMLSKDYDLSGITLIAANTIDSRVQNYFNRTVLYIRPSLTSSKIFNLGQEAIIEFSGPTVANLGFALACDMGFESIYLFGVDLGARDPNKHHAKDTIYESGVIEAGVSAEEINIPVPANFGGPMLSEHVYLWAKSMFEVKARRFKSRSQFYNCSDGARIDGFLPKLSSSITLPKQEDKKAVFETIFNAYPRFTEEQFKASWDSSKFRYEIRRLRNDLLACCGEDPIDDFDENKEIDTPPSTSNAQTENEPLNVRSLQKLENADVLDEHSSPLPSQDRTATSLKPTKKTAAAASDLDYQVAITRELMNDTTPEAGYRFFRGSMYLMMISIHYFSIRTAPGEKRELVTEIGRQETAQQIIKVASYILWFYDYLEGKIDIPPPVGAYKDIAN